MNNILHLFLNTSYLKTQLAEKQYKQEAAELSVLQYQINPHFLFNTLQTVNLEILKLSGDTRPVLDILKKLAEILKYSLITPMQPVLLREELEYLKDYVSIQQSRTVHPFIVYYEVRTPCWICMCSAAAAAPSGKQHPSWYSGAEGYRLYQSADLPEPRPYTLCRH